MKINLESFGDYILRPIKSAPEGKKGLNRLAGSVALGILTLGASHLAFAARDYLEGKKMAQVKKEQEITGIFKRELDKHVHEKPKEGSTRLEVEQFEERKIEVLESVLKREKGTEAQKQLILTALQSLKANRANRPVNLRDLFNHEFDYTGKQFPSKLGELLALEGVHPDFIIQKIELLEKAQVHPAASPENREEIARMLLFLQEKLDAQ